MNLNPQQVEAIHSTHPHIFLLAGAGSGKTRVIVERVKRLINQNVNPKEILCITFTRKASLEMQERINNPDVSIHTFHQYCYQKLKEKKDFEVIGENPPFTQKQILQFAIYKNSLFKTRKPKKYKQYQKYLKNNNLLDFDDLLINHLKDAKNHNYQHIFVDEFQDTNLLQYTILKQMIKEDTSTFCVGDPDQSIYKFRGSNSSIIHKYIKDFRVKLLKLEYNYRSYQAILDCANNLIKHNSDRFKKTLKTTNPHQSKSYLYINLQKSDKVIFQKIKTLIKETPTIETAILYRCHFMANQLKNYLENNYILHLTYLTFHQAKGLEFERVIIINSDNIPYDKDNTYSNKEEERRLLFVGITRAKKELHLFCSKKTKFLNQLKLKYTTIN